MLCIDIKTRKLIWKYNCKGWIAVDAVLSENILLVCDRGEGLKALDKNTGKVIWRNENYIF
jgi:outer membrane protein assembly factor BamB